MEPSASPSVRQYAPIVERMIRRDPAMPAGRAERSVGGAQVGAGRERAGVTRTSAEDGTRWKLAQPPLQHPLAIHHEREDRAALAKSDDGARAAVRLRCEQRDRWLAERAERRRGAGQRVAVREVRLAQLVSRDAPH
jgi:hypothetical protein